MQATRENVPNVIVDQLYTLYYKLEKQKKKDCITHSNENKCFFERCIVTEI